MRANSPSCAETHHTRDIRFSGHREIKGSSDGENASNGVHPAFVTPIRRTAARNEKKMSKERDEYPTPVTSAYNLMLEWHTKPGLMQGGSVQRDNHLAFAQQNAQVEGKSTAKIYKNITCYRCVQLVHYSGSCPFKEDKKEKLKGKGSIPENIVQEFNCVTTEISSMHVDHEADKSNVETEYNSKSNNKDNDEYGRWVGR